MLQPRTINKNSLGLCCSYLLNIRFSNHFQRYIIQKVPADLIASFCRFGNFIDKPMKWGFCYKKARSYAVVIITFISNYNYSRQWLTSTNIFCFCFLFPCFISFLKILLGIIGIIIENTKKTDTLQLFAMINI